LKAATKGKLRATHAVLFQLSEGELEVAPVVLQGAATGYCFESGTFPSSSAVLVGIELPILVVLCTNGTAAICRGGLGDGVEAMELVELLNG